MKVIESYLIQWIFSFLLRYFRNFPLKPNDKITNPIFRSLIVQRSIWISLVNVLLKNIRQALIWAVDFRQRLGLHIQFFWNSLMKWSISKISGVVKLFLVIFGFQILHFIKSLEQVEEKNSVLIQSLKENLLYSSNWVGIIK